MTVSDSTQRSVRTRGQRLLCLSDTPLLSTHALHDERDVDVLESCSCCDPGLPHYASRARLVPPIGSLRRSVLRARSHLQIGLTTRLVAAPVPPRLLALGGVAAAGGRTRCEMQLRCSRTHTFLASVKRRDQQSRKQSRRSFLLNPRSSLVAPRSSLAIVFFATNLSAATMMQSLRALRGTAATAQRAVASSSRLPAAIATASSASAAPFSTSARASLAQPAPEKKMVKLTIDGKEVEVEQGTALIQACEIAGAQIPR